MDRPKAFWQVQLLVECPGCVDWVDLCDTDDFWHDRSATFGPFSNVDAFEAYCPNCGHEFICDAEH